MKCPKCGAPLNEGICTRTVPYKCDFFYITADNVADIKSLVTAIHLAKGSLEDLQRTVNTSFKALSQILELVLIKFDNLRREPNDDSNASR